MKIRLPLLLSCCMCVALPVFAAQVEVEVENQTSWEIHEIYFAPTSQEDWGEDHLGDYVLESGMTLSLTGVSPGKWDIRLVDEDEDVCVLESVHIKNSETWVVTDEDLLGCQAATEE